MYWVVGGLVWIVLAGLIVWAVVVRRRRVPCRSCGLSMDPREAKCPYCGAHQQSD